MDKHKISCGRIMAAYARARMVGYGVPLEQSRKWMFAECTCREVTR